MIAERETNSSHYISTKTAFISSKCAEDYKNALNGEEFFMESNDKRLYFGEEVGMLWKKRRMTMWEYSNSTLQMRVHASDTCLAWAAQPNHTAELTLQPCRDSMQQRFRLFQTGHCTWSLLAVEGRVLNMGEDSLARDQDSSSHDNVNRLRPIYSARYNQSKESQFKDDGTVNRVRKLRNFQSFKLMKSTSQCRRFEVVNGELLPAQFNAPIFLEGDSITVQCKANYTVKRKEERENRITVTCKKRDLRKVICRNGKKSRVPQDIFLVFVSCCCILLGYKCVRHLQTSRVNDEVAEVDVVINGENREEDQLPAESSHKDSNNVDAVSENVSQGCTITNSVNETASQISKSCEIIPNPTCTTLQPEETSNKSVLNNAKCNEETELAVECVTLDVSIKEDTSLRSDE